MKYIINVPTDRVKNGLLQVLIHVENGVPRYIGTGISVKPYNEPNRQTIEDEVWELAKKLISMSGNEMSEMWGCATNFGEVMHNTTYSEAKAKYDEWKKQKERDEVRVGDEIEAESGNKACVFCYNCPFYSREEGLK